MLFIAVSAFSSGWNYSGNVPVALAIILVFFAIGTK
jgi:hypothetical protein